MENRIELKFKIDELKCCAIIHFFPSPCITTTDRRGNRRTATNRPTQRHTYHTRRYFRPRGK
uniref:Uncharacterized protein n=1 Tax=Romanomermis culicivorax TaxID=13658 RepID=A0A915L1C3_ROMCU